MSLDKAIKHGKEKRKRLYGAKSVSPSCRSHGGCPACEGARQYKNKRRQGIQETPQ